MLAWHPGEMTRRYIAGERARFVSPIALYLFTVFLMFAVLELHRRAQPDPESFKLDLQEEIARDERALASLRQAQGSRRPQGGAWPSLDRRIAKRKEDIAEQPEGRDRPGLRVGRNGCGRAGLGPAAGRGATKTRMLMSTRSRTTASKYSWLLIPLSVPFLWLLFPLQPALQLYDHTVFVTYSLSFMMMLVIAGGLLVAAGSDGACRLPVLRPAVPHVPAAQGRLSSWAASARWCGPSRCVVRVHRRRPVPGRDGCDRNDVGAAPEA